ncbi:MAG TPA: biotin transporter BioY [Candidatus Limnocylindria bacterium]|nr:biotin transporter BioY [Candidatus Limnocylindria bacterium]
MIAARPIALVVLPGSLLWKLVLVLAGSALIALAAQVRIPLPFSPVPVTGQTFAVLLVAAALGRLGLASVIAYLLGLAWLARFPLPVPLLDAGLIPFIPGDLFKMVLAALALPAAWKVVRR